MREETLRSTISPESHKTRLSLARSGEVKLTIDADGAPLASITLDLDKLLKSLRRIASETPKVHGVTIKPGPGGGVFLTCRDKTFEFFEDEIEDLIEAILRAAGKF